MELDARNGNNKWKEAVEYEMGKLHELSAFTDMGPDAKPPAGYQKIRTHMVFDVKHDGRHRARLVADGDPTEVPLDSVYSGVISLRGL